MEHAAIQGTFADLKSVKTRSVVQMVVEIPIEQAERVVSLFGFPQPGAEIAVAVARLDQNIAKSPVATPEKAKRHWDGLSYAEQAGIRCNDPSFQFFLREVQEYESVGTEQTAGSVRLHCDVDSRAEFDKNDDAARRWEALDAEFQEWNGQRAEQR